MIFIPLLTFHIGNLVGSTNRLDPTYLNSGRVGSGLKVRVEIDVYSQGEVTSQ